MYANFNKAANLYMTVVNKVKANRIHHVHRHLDEPLKAKFHYAIQLVNKFASWFAS